VLPWRQSCDESEVREAVDRVVLNTAGSTPREPAGGLTRYKPAVEHTLEDWKTN